MWRKLAAVAWWWVASLPCAATMIESQAVVYSTPFATTLDCANLGGELGGSAARWAASCVQQGLTHSGNAWASAGPLQVIAGVEMTGAEPAYLLGAYAGGFVERDVMFAGGVGRGQVEYHLTGEGWVEFAAMGFSCSGASCRQGGTAEIEFGVPFVLRMSAEAWGNSGGPGRQESWLEFSGVQGASLMDVETPEPRAWTLVTLGLAGLALLSRKTTR
jgi:hypothetical protein